MWIFKTITSVYKTFVSTKKVCCQSLEKSLLDLSEHLEKVSKEQANELDKKYKDLFEKYKTGNACINSHDFLSYINGEITNEQYEIKQRAFKIKITKAIQDVEAGTMSYRDFFELIK